MRLAVYLVGSIDEDGYLRRDLESVADDIAFTVGVETTSEEPRAAAGDHPPAGTSRSRRPRPAGVSAAADGPDDARVAGAAHRAEDRRLLFRRVRQEALRETDGAPPAHRGGVPRGDRRDPPPFARRATSMPREAPIRRPTSSPTSSSTIRTGSSCCRSTPTTCRRCASAAATST